MCPPSKAKENRRSKIHKPPYKAISMNFTDRYIELPIAVYNKRHKELTGKEELIDAPLKMLPFELSEYYPSDDEGVWKTQIFLKNGQSYIIELNVSEFEKAINNHQNK